MSSKVFTPPFYLRSAPVQIMLASSMIRGWGTNTMLTSAREVILNLSEDVRLQGFYSSQPNGEAKGVILLLHGWEGSAHSAYILHTGSFLFNNGFSVFRLNYRDHGNTHHLNSGLFYAVLIDEVFNAIEQVSYFESELPFYLAGFSMGGNFALRIARKSAEHPINNLSHVMSISPVLDPEKSTYAIDGIYLLQKYFRKKWLRSLKKKQACFPNLYDFREVFELETIMEMTELMIARYSDYSSAREYFRQYTLLNDALRKIHVPVTIITAADDPIIPVQDFYRLKLNDLSDLLIQPYGGHNGFIETISGRAWYESKMLEKFE